MTLAAPAFLGLLALLPLVVYLHMRRRPTRRVASTRIWSRVAAEAHTRPRPTAVRVSSSLLLQLAFVVLAALALADPRPVHAGGTHHVLVIDAGREAGRPAQEGAGASYESAWHRWLNSLPAVADRNRYSVWWVGPWARPVALELTSVPGVLRALESTTYSNAPADWLAARRVLSAQDLTDAVVTVVAHDVAAAEAALSDLDAPTMSIVPLGAQGLSVELSDAKVTLEDADAQRWSVAAVARLKLSRAPIPDTVTFRVAFLPDGATAWLPYEERQVRVNAAGQAVFTSTQAFPGAGIAEVAVTEAGRGVAEGRRLFRIDPRPRSPTAIVLTEYGETSPTARLLMATGRFDVVVATGVDALGPADLLVVEGWPRDFGGTVPDVRAVLWLGAGPESHVAAASAIEIAHVVRWDHDHPATRGTDWSAVRGTKAIGIVPFGEVLVEGTNGPLVVTRTTRVGREVVVAFDVGDTTFTESDAFLTFLVDAIDWLVPVEAPVSACSVGRSCRVPWRLVASGFEARLEGGPVWRQPPPAGFNVPSRLDEAWVPLRAGLWWLTSAQGDVLPYPVNPVVEGPTSTAASVETERTTASSSVIGRFGLVAALLFACCLLVALENTLEGRKPGGFFRPGELVRRGPAARRQRRTALLNMVALVSLLAATLAAPFLIPRVAPGAVLVTDGSSRAWSSTLASGVDRLEEVRADDSTGAVDLQRVMEEAAARIDPALDLEVVFPAGLTGSRGDGVFAIAPLLDRRATVHVLEPPVPDASLDLVAWGLHHAGTLFVGDEIDVTGVVHASRGAEARVTLRHDDQVIGEWSLEVPVGWSTFTARTVLVEAGSALFRLEVVAPDDTAPANDVLESAVTVDEGPSVSVVASDLASGEAFADALRLHGFATTVLGPHAVPARPEAFAGTDVVVLMDVAALDLARNQQEAMESWVRVNGGGLAILGGERSFGPGGYLETPLDAVSPLSARVSRDAPAVSMLFVLDRSGSMQQNVGGVTRLDIAKEATIAATELLGPGSEVAVVVFDEDARVLLPFTDAASTGTIAAALRPMVPGGGTSLYPALLLAGDLLATTDASSKHVVVMTDGLSRPGDFEGAVERLVDLDATVSAIAIGAGADSARVRNIARIGRGAAHITSDFRALPSILAQETMLMAGDPVVRESVTPNRTDAQPAFMSTTPPLLPPLHGLVETTPKADATVLIDDEMGRPVLAAWRYGAGRALAFTSQGVGPWASEWNDAPQYAEWWSSWLRWAVAGGRPLGVDVKAHLVGDEIRLDVLATDDSGSPRTGLRLTAVAMPVTAAEPGTGFEPGETHLSEVEPGRYVASLPTGLGLHRVHVRDLESRVEVADAVLVNRSYAAARDAPRRTDPLLEGLVDLTGGTHMASGANWRPTHVTTWEVVRARRPWAIIAVAFWTLSLFQRYAPGWLVPAGPRQVGLRRAPRPGRSAIDRSA